MAFDIRETEFVLPENWKLVRLGDIAKVNEKSLTKKSQPDFIRYIDISSVSTGTVDTPKFLKKDEAPSRARRILRNNDFIISTVRPNLKQFAFIEEAQENLIASTGFCVISSNNSKLSWYLYSLITSDLFTEYLVKIADGGAYPAFNPKEIEDAIIPLPDKDNLKFISDTSRFFYQKIQLNTQINQTLEQIAQALFKSWFVDFDPVRAKVQALSDGLSLEQAELAAMQAISGKTPEELTALSQTQPDHYAKLAETAKAFPCEMVEVDGVEVPKGWEIQYLKDICNIVYGKNLPTTKLIKEGYPVFGGNGVIGYYDKFLYETPQTLVSCRGAASGKVLYSLPYSFVTNNSLVIEHEKSGLSYFYIYEALKLQNLTELTSGSAQPQMTIANMASIQILIPSEKIHEVYKKYVGTLYDKKYHNNIENETLAQTRDLLLPRLLSGDFND